MRLAPAKGSCRPLSTTQAGGRCRPETAAAARSQRTPQWPTCRRRLVPSGKSIRVIPPVQRLVGQLTPAGYAPFVYWPLPCCLRPSESPQFSWLPFLFICCLLEHPRHPRVSLIAIDVKFLGVRLGQRTTQKELRQKCAQTHRRI